MAAKNLIKLADGAYKVKQTEDQNNIEKTKTNAVDVNCSVLTSDSMIVLETQEAPTVYLITTNS